MKYVVVALFLSVSSAFAGEVDFSRHIVDLDGKDIPSSQAKDAPPLDLATVVGMALLTEPPADPRGGKATDPAEKLARFALALKAHVSGKIEVTAEEITLMKTAIAQVYGPLVVGRAVEILDPAQMKK